MIKSVLLLRELVGFGRERRNGLVGLFGLLAELGAGLVEVVTILWGGQGSAARRPQRRRGAKEA